MSNESLLRRWQSLSSKKRMLIAGGGGFALLITAVSMVTPSTPVPVSGKTPQQKVTATNLGLPGTIGPDTSIEQLNASLDAVKKNQTNMKTELDAKIAATTTQAEKRPPTDPATVEELRQLREKVAALEGSKSISPNYDMLLDPKQKKLPASNKGSDSLAQLDEQLPQQTHNGGYVEPSADPVLEEHKEPEQKFRVTGGKRKTESEEYGDVVKPKPAVFMPAGSSFEGVLLNGMDAPTSGIAQKNPVPAVMRVKSDAIMPNRFRYDVRECFVVVSGYGVLSTERAQLQTVTLSCIKSDGAVIESKMEGYVVGEDGKVGLRGRLVTKQGQVIAKSFAAGFFGGVANSLAPTAVPQMNIAPGTTQQYQTPNIGAIVSSGTAQGITQSAKAISQFYLDVAKEMFPVVEIDASRRATIVLVKGMELNLIGDKK